MADLEPLIRYKKHGVDEKRRFLSQLYQEAEHLATAKKGLEEEIEKESALTAELGTPDALTALAAFTKATKAKIKLIEQAIVHMNVRIAAAQEDMRESFAEMKKVEITQRSREEREAAEQERKENQDLDEIGLEQFRRQQEEQEDQDED